MAISMLLLRALIRRQAHPLASSSPSAAAAYSSRCLTDNVKKQRSATSPLSKNLMSLASRPFSSKPLGDFVFAEREDATKVRFAFIDPLKVILDPDHSECVAKIVEAPGGDAWVKQKDDEGVLRYSLSQYGPCCFTTMKKLKELEYGTTLSKAVVFVPSYFNDDLRDAAKDAATIAGFDVLKILTDESSVDERSYDIIKGQECRHLSILDLRHGAFFIHIEEIIPVGDASKILETFVREIKRIYGMDIRSYPLEFRKIEEMSEKLSVGLLLDLDLFPKTNIVKFQGSVGDKFISRH